MAKKLRIFRFLATFLINMDRYESVDLLQTPVNSNNLKIHSRGLVPEDIDFALVRIYTRTS